MRALSLWQPWASAIAVGAKRVETRSWATPYRGLVAIHAAKRMNQMELIGFKSSWNWCGALRSLGVVMGGREALWDVLPFGAVVAVAEIVACLAVGDFTGRELDSPRRPDGPNPEHYEWTERQMGDFSLGRYGWRLANVRALVEPIPMRGFQGLWELDAEVTSSILRRVKAA